MVNSVVPVSVILRSGLRPAGILMEHREGFPPGRTSVSEIIRIGPEEVRRKVQAGETLLVCAYEEDWKFRQMNLEGAISFSDFRSKLPSLSKSREIVFYCA